MSAPPPETLLVAVDDSDSSDVAFKWAARAAAALGAELHLVHVVPRQLTAPAEEYEKILKAAEALVIKRFIARLPEGTSPRPVVHIIKSETDTDSVGHILVKKAAQLNAVTLVLSSHNKGKVAEFFVGSVVKHVTAHAHTPVTVVPAPRG